jgi:hypothetical protein
MKKLIAGLIVGMLVSTSAFAWGPREQGILAGAAGLWTIQQLTRPNAIINVNGNPVNVNPVYVQPAPQVYVSPPVYTQPQVQQWCESVPVVDQFGGHRTVQYCYYR